MFPARNTYSLFLGNPTFIPTNELLASNVTHVFLIRSPEESVPSWARLGRRADIGVGCFSRQELGIRQSATLYKYLETNLETPPLIIDTDDIFGHSEAIVRKLCELMNVDFQQCMLQWPDNPAVTELFSKWEGRPVCTLLKFVLIANLSHFPDRLA